MPTPDSPVQESEVVHSNGPAPTVTSVSAFEDEQPVAGSSSPAQAPELDLLMAKIVSYVHKNGSKQLLSSMLTMSCILDYQR